MRVRNVLALIGVVALVAVPVTLAGNSASTSEATAKGDNVRWTIPLPNVFGVEVGNRLSFNARKRANGRVSGRINYAQTVEGETVHFRIDVTCMAIYDNGTRAKVGGVITRTDDPTVPVGVFGWFQFFDLNSGGHDDDDDDDDGDSRNDDDDDDGGGPADRSSLMGLGDEAANEAFCASPNLPRLGPWDVRGDIRIRG